MVLALVPPIHPPPHSSFCSSLPGKTVRRIAPNNRFYPPRAQNSPRPITYLISAPLQPPARYISIVLYRGVTSRARGGCTPFVPLPAPLSPRPRVPTHPPSIPCLVGLSPPYQPTYRTTPPYPSTLPDIPSALRTFTACPPASRVGSIRGGFPRQEREAFRPLRDCTLYGMDVDPDEEQPPLCPPPLLNSSCLSGGQQLGESNIGGSQ